MRGEDNIAGVAAPLYEEEPAFFAAGDERLFGVLTRPVGANNGITVTMLTGGGYVTSTHRNRLNVRLARRLAARGYHAFRFDYHGTGESTGTVDEFVLDRPFVEDLRGAVQWLDGKGLVRHVLMGSCFGARTVLAFAPEVAGIEGTALVAAPVRDAGYVFARRQAGYALDETDTDGISPAFLGPFRALVARPLPVLLVYGTEDRARDHFDGPELGDLVGGTRSFVELALVPGHAHQFANLELQETVMTLVLGWLERSFSS